MAGINWFTGAFSLCILFLLFLEPVHSEMKNVQLSGAGASFPSQVYKTWMPLYRATRSEFASVDMTYEAIGSGSGKKRIMKITDPEVQYAGSDSLLKEEDYVEYPDLQMFPTLAGAVVLGFNIPGVTELILSRAHVVGIYNGTYTLWNDSSIQALNPAVTMPGEKILVLSRADKSGTTEIFTSALSSFDSHWDSNYGIFNKGVDSDFNPYSWNASVVTNFAQTELGMTGLIMSIKYTIGYLSVSGAKESKIVYAKIVNQYGTTTEASVENVQAAMNDFAATLAASAHLTTSIVNGEGINSYPIAGYTYMIIYKTTLPNCDSAVELYRYVEWLSYDALAHTECEEMYMSPLSAVVADKVKDKVLDLITCQGANVKLMVDAQKDEEAISMQTWRTYVYIAVPLGIVLLIAILSCVVAQQIQINQKVLSNIWRIPYPELEPLASNEMGRSSMSVAKGGSMVSFKSEGAKTAVSITGFKEGSVDPKQVKKWSGKYVWVQSISGITARKIGYKEKKCLIWMMESVAHENLQKFYGLTEEMGTLQYVREFCHKGTLRDILQNDKFNLDLNFKFSMGSDISVGMAFLHKLELVHGHLKSSCCHIDSRWTVKITDWEIEKFCEQLSDYQSDEENYYNNDANVVARSQFWTAPEILRSALQLPTVPGDMYSFGIVLQEIFTREDPYFEVGDELDPEGIIFQVKNKMFRPLISREISKKVVMIMERAWAENVPDRPTFLALVQQLRSANPSKQSVLDCMMSAVEEYTKTLELKVEERAADLAIATKKMETLLHQMIPASVASQLSQGITPPPEKYESITLLFSDCVGFSELSIDSTSLEIVNFLNELYIMMDDYIDHHDTYKVETIGDSYMVVSGLPERNGDKHAYEIADLALEFASGSGSFEIKHEPTKRLQLRVGINSGMVAAGVVGLKAPRYCLFGDTVNTTSRMMSTSKARKIQCTSSAYKLLSQDPTYDLAARGEITVKGKGKMTTYWLNGKRGFPHHIPVEFSRVIESC